MKRYNNEDIYEIIKNDIISLFLEPGSKVKEEDLATRFNVSRTPIRWAIARLEKDSLVYVVPKKGTFVSKIDIKDLEAQRYIRKCVEKSVIKELINIITPENIKELESILEKQRKIVEKEPSVEKSRDFYNNDNIFHKALFTFANKENVWNMLNKEQPVLNRIRIIANMRPNSDVYEVYLEHLKMVEALKNKDEETCLKAFDEHLDNGFVNLDSVDQKYRGYFIC